MSLGQRYGVPNSFLVKANGASGHPESHYEQVNVLHIVFRHFLRSKLLPNLTSINDTNVGLKCFHAADLPQFLLSMTTFGPAFDVELLLLALGYFRSRHGDATPSLADIVSTEPIVFVEDFEQSNFTANASNPDASFKSFASMTAEIVQMHMRYVTRDSMEARAGENVFEFAQTLDFPRYKALILGMEAAMGRQLFFDQEFTVDQLCAFVEQGSSLSEE